MLGFEKDLIPEGIAIDGGAKVVYLSSLKKNKIVRSNLDGSSPINFIESNQFGYLPGFGMTIKGDTLYALGNSNTPEENNQSILLLLDVKTAHLIKSYIIDKPGFRYLNDMTISSDNNIFITDSESNKVYRIIRPNKRIEVFMETDEIIHPNGIAISTDDQHLYVASQKGIRIIAIMSKKILNDPDLNLSGIDGLKFYKNSLIGIVNARKDAVKNGIFRYYLNEQGTSIIRSEKLVEASQTHISTTFDILDNYMYYVSNTQLDQLNSLTNQIIDPEKLEPYVLMKRKLSE